MENPIYEDPDRDVLSKYLDAMMMPVSVNSHEVANDVTSHEVASDVVSVYKYKPVALKTRPVVQELPAEFRIKREIIGDSLAEMPKLFTNLPDFEPTGRKVHSRVKGPI